MAKFIPTFRLGNIDVDPNTDQLKCGDVLIEIQSMAMKVLCYFCHNSERLITRDNLRDEVWKNTATSNHTINNHIYSLRRNIAKLDPDVKYIHTVTGGGVSGYRLSETLIYNDDAGMPLQDAAHVKDMGMVSDLVTDSVDLPYRSTKLNIIVFSVFVTIIFLLFFGIYQSSQSVTYRDVSMLTEQAGREQSPSVSADGSLVLYANKHSQYQSWELYASKLATPSQSVKVFTSEGNRDNFVSISPNGQRIAFHRFNYDEEGIYIAEFNSETLQASQDRIMIPLSRENLSTSISWLGDEQFFYSVKEAPWAPKRIFLFDINSGKSEQISSPALQSNGDFANVVSPNQQWLAILRASGYGGVELLLYDIATKTFINTQVKLSQSRLNISFNDDSKSVFFIDDAGYLSEFGIDSHIVSRISQESIMGYWPIKIPGRDQFILQQEWGLSSLTTEIVSFSNPVTGGDASKKLVLNNGMSIRAIEGVNDNGFIFISVKANHQIQLWRYKGDKAFKLDQFREKDEYRYPLSLYWQRQTDQALLSVNGGCRSININTGKDSPLCPNGEEVYAGTYSTGGESIYFAAFNDKQSKAVKMGSSGYPIKSLPQMPNANMVLDGGNGFLYYRIDPGTDIYQFDIELGESSKLIDRHYIANGYTTNDFVVVDEGIYFMDKPRNKSNAIYYYSFRGGEVRYLFDTPNLYPNIVLSEDHQLIYLIQSSHNETGLLLIE